MTDYLASATVEIGTVEIIPDDGPPLTLTDDGGTHNLLDLQNGVTADLASLDIPTGHYVQLRLVVNGAAVTLNDGYEFADGSTEKSLKVPSGLQSGIKVNLAPSDGQAGSAGIDITEGETTLVVDIDVSQNFKIQGNPDTPAGIKGILFTPLLRATVSDVAGSISGSVTTSTSEPVDGLTVTAALDGSSETFPATTDGDGNYTIPSVPPGTYHVTVALPDAGFTTDPTEQTVVVGENEDVTGVNFEIVEAP